VAESDAADPLDDLVEEFLAGKRAGKAPTLEEFIARHPEQADEIRELFPMIAAMEDAKADRQFGPSGRIRLGAARPSRLGEFRILREIGRGGMGVVFEAHQESLDRRVALKVLPRTIQNPQVIERFQREARLAASLHHPNIVTVHSIGEEDNTHFFAMQLVHGISWDRLIEHLTRKPEDRLHPLGSVVAHMLDGTALTGSRNAPAAAQENYFRQVARLVRDAATGLHYAHGSGMLHRDVKPGNLLLDVEGRVFLTDFGLARALQSAGHAATCDSVGTLRYMAPEQLENRADMRSDVYGLGIAFYELLTLQRAYGALGGEGLLQKMRRGERPDLAMADTIPQALRAIILKATDPRPERRFANAAAFATALERYLAGRGARFAFTPVRALLVGSALGLIAVLAAWSFSRAPEAEPQKLPPPLFDPSKPPAPRPPPRERPFRPGERPEDRRGLPPKPPGEGAF